MNNLPKSLQLQANYLINVYYNTRNLARELSISKEVRLEERYELAKVYGNITDEIFVNFEKISTCLVNITKDEYLNLSTETEKFLIKLSKKFTSEFLVSNLTLQEINTAETIANTMSTFLENYIFENYADEENEDLPLILASLSNIVSNCTKEEFCENFSSKIITKWK